MLVLYQIYVFAACGKALSRIVKFARHCSASKAGKKIVFVYANDLLDDTMVKLPFFFFAKGVSAG